MLVNGGSLPVAIAVFADVVVVVVVVVAVEQSSCSKNGHYYKASDLPAAVAAVGICTSFRFGLELDSCRWLAYELAAVDELERNS